MTSVREKLVEKFQAKEYRDTYVGSFLNSVISTQLRVLREQRGWTQKELAKRAGMKQSRISTMENVNYSNWSISTLQRLASALDVALAVRFESFGELMSSIESFGRQSLQKLSFDDDFTLQEDQVAKLDWLWQAKDFSWKDTTGDWRIGGMEASTFSFLSKNLHVEDSSFATRTLQ